MLCISLFKSKARNLFQTASRFLSFLDVDIFNNQFSAANNLPLSFDLAFYSLFKTWTAHYNIVISLQLIKINVEKK